MLTVDLQAVVKRLHSNNLWRKQNHAFARRNPICAYLRLSSGNVRNYIFCGHLKIADRAAELPKSRKFISSS